MKHSFTPVSQRKQLDLARKPLLAAMMGILLLAGSFTVHATSVIKMKTMRQPNGEITILVRGNGPFQVEGARPATIGSGEVTLKLTSQNVSLSGDINYLNCSENDLETLDVTGCQSLTELECYENSLTKLPLDKNEKLINLTCDYNPIDTLDLTHNPHLQNLLCPNNSLKYLNLENNKELKALYCFSNQLVEIKLPNDNNLEEILCSSNEIHSLDLQGCKNLQLLECYYNYIETLNLANCKQLTKLSANGNSLKELDLSSNPKLVELSCAGNELSSITLPQNAALLAITCFNNKIQGEAMKNLMNSLPDIKGKNIVGDGGGEIIIVNTPNQEDNRCYKSDVAIATAKGWKVMDFNGNYTERKAYVGENDPSGVYSISSLQGIAVKVLDRTIAIDGDFDKATLYNVNGQQLISTQAHEINAASAGVYVLCIEKKGNSHTCKVLVK